MLKLKVKAEEIDDFPAFYHAHERLVRSVLYSLARREELDDLVQQTFFRCWQSRDQFKGHSQLSTWVCRIAINIARDNWRKNHSTNAQTDSELPDNLPDAKPSAALRLESRQALELAMAKLSFEHRTVLILTYFHDLTIQETSLALGEAEGTVKSRLHYAKERLSELLVKMGIEV